MLTILNKKKYYFQGFRKHKTKLYDISGKFLTQIQYLREVESGEDRSGLPPSKFSIHFIKTSYFRIIKIFKLKQNL